MKKKILCGLVFIILVSLVGCRKNVNEEEQNIIAENEILKIQENMDLSDKITIRKGISKDILNEDSIDSTIEEYIISEIDIIKNTDITKDYTNYKDGQDTSELETLNFEDVFNFNYTKYDNSFDIIMNLLKAQGINTDLENATLDESLYEKFGQRTYRLNRNSKVLDNIISSLDYDNIIDSYCEYTLSGDDTNSFIGYIDIRIKYEKDDKTMFYTVNYVIELFDENGNENISCGCSDNEEGICDGTCGEIDCDGNCNYLTDINYE